MDTSWQSSRSGLCVWLMALVLVLSGCHSTSRTRSAKASGFLPDYSNLQPGKRGEAQWVYFRPGVNWAGYDKIYLESVTVWAADKSSLRKVSPADLQALTDHLYESMCSQLATHFQLVNGPGPGVLWVRGAITEARKSKVVADVTTTVVPQLRLVSSMKKLATGTHAFVGRAGIEGEVLDGASGEQLAAVVDERAGNKVLRGSFDKWGDVKAAYDFWAKRFAGRLVQLRAQASEPVKAEPLETQSGR